MTMEKKKSRARSSWKNKDRIIRTGDSFMVGGRPTDIVIPVMGPTGVGKSSFINHLLGKNAMPVGHEVSSCTSTIQYAIVDPPPRKGHRVIIVDMPGFDDTYEDDVEILRRIAVWLASSYNDNMKLGGIIYLVSIADKRMKGTTLRNLEMFFQLCGDKALARVVLGTTNWGEVNKDVGEKREQQLNKTFWSTMTSSGSSLRFERTHESARTFLDAILNKLEFGADEGILNVTKDRIIKTGDSVVVGGRSTDIVIPVIGPTGVGKSSFINDLLGKNAMAVGHDLKSCTSTIQYAIVDPSPRKGHRVIIVDTPGFDNAHGDDEEILRRITAWLASSYDENMKLGGVIYLQSIADKRMKNVTLKDLETFFQLCGDKALARVVLGTTNWEEVKEGVGAKREQQLDKTFWNTLNASGSKSLRFERTHVSAQVFLDAILNKFEFNGNEVILSDNIVLRIQKELVELERRIPETAAGKKLRYTLEQLLEMQKDEADSEKKAALSASIEKQIAELRIPLSRKFVLFFGKMGISLY